MVPHEAQAFAGSLPTPPDCSPSRGLAKPWIVANPARQWFPTRLRHSLGRCQPLPIVVPHEAWPIHGPLPTLPDRGPQRGLANPRAFYQPWLALTPPPPPRFGNALHRCQPCLVVGPHEAWPLCGASPNRACQCSPRGLANPWVSASLVWLCPPPQEAWPFVGSSFTRPDRGSAGGSGIPWLCAKPFPTIVPNEAWPIHGPLPEAAVPLLVSSRLAWSKARV